MRKIRWAAYGLIVVLGLGWGVFLLGGDRGALSRVTDAASGMQLPGGVSLGGPFSLVDTQQNEVTDASFRGRWMLVYFGYTYCPDVCPTELQAMVDALDKLGPGSLGIAPIFITIDPERDTPASLADYVKLFDNRLIGLTGTPVQIAAAAKAYRVYYAKSTPKDAGTYLMDHSSFIYLMGPDGKFRALFRQGMSPQELADGIRARMAGS